MTDWAARDQAAAADAAQRLGVPLQWVLAVIGAESSFGASQKTWEASAGEYSYGPMQILGSTARDRGFTGDTEELLTPETGIFYGTAQLAWLIGQYGEDFPSVISAYNRGHADPAAGAGYIARVSAWLQELPQDAADAAAAIGDNQTGAALIAAGVLLMWLAWRLPPSRGRRYGRS